MPTFTDFYATQYTLTSSGTFYGVDYFGNLFSFNPSQASYTNLTLTGLLTQAGEDSLTAHAGGTQAGALALSATVNNHRISVCATAGDSVKLPPATVSQVHYVRNDGAAASQVFGSTTDTINGVATATGVSLSAATGAFFVCTTAGKWTSTALSSLSLPVSVANGGTGLATLTDKALMLGAGTGNVTFLAPGSSGNVPTSDGTNWTSAAPASSATPYACFQEQQTSANSADTVTNGSVRTLNTTVVNAITGASLASNQITLAAGTYQIRAVVPLGVAAAANQINTVAILQKVSGSVTMLISQSVHVISLAGLYNGMGFVVIFGQFVATAGAYQIVQYVSATGGGGYAASLVATEIYTSVELWKVA